MTAVKPCGTLAAHSRHRRRGEPIDEACRDAAAEYGAAYALRRGSSPPSPGRISRIHAIAAETRKAQARLEGREGRVVQVGDTVVRVGELACDDIVHVFVPDTGTGTQCLACFGWYTDVRHVPPPPRMSRTAAFM